VLISDRDRGSEERVDAVAGQVLDRPAERLDGVDHTPNGAAEDLTRILGIQQLRQLRRADDVGEQGGHDLALLPHLAAHGPILLVSPGGGNRRVRPSARSRERRSSIPTVDRSGA
jgi:hypothetical protein